MRCCARRRSWSRRGPSELLVISQDTSAYGVDTRHEPRQWKGREVRAHMTDLARELGGLRTAKATRPGCGCTMSTPIRMSTQVIPLMAEGLLTPYLDIPFQHAAPERAQAHEAPRERGQGARTDQDMARTSRPTSPSAPASSSAFPARPRRTSNICSTGSTKPSSTASAPSASNRSRARRPTRCPIRCPKRSRKNATSGSWKRPPRSAPPSSPPRSAARCR